MTRKLEQLLTQCQFNSLLDYEIYQGILASCGRCIYYSYRPRVPVSVDDKGKKLIKCENMTIKKLLS